MALIICDVNGLKQVNDTSGHDSGDAVLEQLAGHLSSVAGTVSGALAARIGGDEFCVLVVGQPWSAVTQLAEDLAARAAKLEDIDRRRGRLRRDRRPRPARSPIATPSSGSPTPRSTKPSAKASSVPSPPPRATFSRVRRRQRRLPRPPPNTPRPVPSSCGPAVPKVTMRSPERLDVSALDVKLNDHHLATDTGTAPPLIDLSDNRFWSLPYDQRMAAFAELRAQPVAPLFAEPRFPLIKPGAGYYALTRHADVVEASRHPELFSSEPTSNSIPDMPRYLATYFGSMINMDDPRHARLRRIVSRAFTPKLVSGLRTDIETASARIVDDLLAHRAGDFVAEAAARLPMQVICTMMGIPERQQAMVLRAHQPHPGRQRPGVHRSPGGRRCAAHQPGRPARAVPPGPRRTPAAPPGRRPGPAAPPERHRRPDLEAGHRRRRR